MTLFELIGHPLFVSSNVVASCSEFPNFLTNLESFLKEFCFLLSEFEFLFGSQRLLLATC